jgi:hypothetical protein
VRGEPAAPTDRWVPHTGQHYTGWAQ